MSFTKKQETKFLAHFEKEYVATQKTIIDVLKAADKDNIKKLLNAIKDHPKVKANWTSEERNLFFPMVKVLLEKGSTVPMPDPKKAFENIKKYWGLRRIFSEEVVPVHVLDDPVSEDKCKEHVCTMLLYMLTWDCGLRDKDLYVIYGAIGKLLSFLNTHPEVHESWDGAECAFLDGIKFEPIDNI